MIFSSIQERQNARKPAGGSKQGEKIGYQARNRPVSLADSGLTNTNNNRTADSPLDDDSRIGLNRVKDRDAEIDKGINEIANSIDRLNAIANTIKDEVSLFLLYFLRELNE